MFFNEKRRYLLWYYVMVLNCYNNFIQIDIWFVYFGHRAFLSLFYIVLAKNDDLRKINNVLLIYWALFFYKSTLAFHQGTWTWFWTSVTATCLCMGLLHFCNSFLGHSFRYTVIITLDAVFLLNRINPLVEANQPFEEFCTTTTPKKKKIQLL